AKDGGAAAPPYWILSSAYYKLARWQESWTAANTGVDLSRRNNQIESLLRSLTWRGRAADHLERKDEGIADALEAAKQSEEIRAGLVADDFLKRGFAEWSRDLAQDAITWLFEAKRHREGLEIAEQARSRAFLDLLATRRLRDPFAFAEEDDDEEEDEPPI